MFSGLNTRLETEVEIVKRVLSFHENVRSLLFDVRIDAHGDVEVVPSPSPLSTIGDLAPGKLAWQIYDHCAAFSRLYGIYAQFIEDLIGDYLKLLPTLFVDYFTLPERILNQHRVGFAHIMAKLGPGGAYRHLDETVITSSLANTLSGKTPYRLLRDAFFTERQNYRLDALQRLFGAVGIEDAPKKLGASTHLQSLKEARSETFSFEKELSDFVDYRNVAAHSQVDQIVSIDDIEKYAELIVALCRAVADVVEDEIIQRQVSTGKRIQLGTVTESLKGGYVVVAILEKGSFKVGDKIVTLRGDSVKVATITSIQINDTQCSGIRVKRKTEVGLGLTHKCKRESLILQVLLPSYPVDSPALTDQAETPPSPGTLTSDVAKIEEVVDESESESEYQLNFSEIEDGS